MSIFAAALLTTVLAGVLFAAQDVALPDISSDLIAKYGLLGYIAYKEVWPFLRDRLYPDLARARRTERSDERKREDRLFETLEANTAAMVKLQGTLEAIHVQMARQSEVIHLQGLDISGLYGYLRVPQPSRERPRAERLGDDLR